MAAAVGDSARRAAADSARAAAAPPPPDTLPVLAVDSMAATPDTSMWAVNVVGGDVRAEVRIPAGVDLATLPVVTLAPLLKEGREWYELYVGAFARREQADSLVEVLRARRALGAASGRVVRVPLALLLADSVPATQAPARIQAFARQQIPAYPLARGDGMVAIYAGAFQTRDEAALLTRTVRAAGLTPRLVYRTGRSL